MEGSLRRLVAALVTAVAVGLVPAGAAAAPPAVSSFEWSKNMHPLGHSAADVPLTNGTPGAGIYNSDLAFWGRTAYQGSYDGFRIVDVSDPEDPQELIDYNDCSPGTTQGNQGDVIVWDDLLVRSWNSPATATSSCDGELVGAGFEGLHVFDVSNPADPDVVASVPLASFGSLPFTVTIASGAAAGTYPAAGANWGTPPTLEGLSGNVVAVDDGVIGAGTPAGTVTDGCEPFTVPAGSIALVDRGFCGFVVKAANAQAAGASAIIVANNVAGAPTTMGGADPNVTISGVAISQAAGAAIRAAGLPVGGTIARNAAFGCGSHTASGAPDLENNRLLVYNSSSAGGTCDFIDIVEVPLDNPSAAKRIGIVESLQSCHDIGIILGDAMKLACAGGTGARIFSLDSADDASMTKPVLTASFTIPGVTIGHSAAWSWDGEILVFGHEPGGGTQARCQETSAEVDRTLFFYDDEGNQLGTFVQPRPQTSVENCTWHNYNVVPTDKGRILVSGNYQMGISVLDFTDPAAVRQIAYADPAPLVDPDPPIGIESGGDWSSYWYDGLIYESDMTRGLTVWNLSDRAVAGARKLGHLNPQTQETSFPLKRG